VVSQADGSPINNLGEGLIKDSNVMAMLTPSIATNLLSVSDIVRDDVNLITITKDNLNIIPTTKLSNQIHYQLLSSTNTLSLPTHDGLTYIDASSIPLICPTINSTSSIQIWYEAVLECFIINIR
jgi:hypothetical protein